MNHLDAVIYFITKFDVEMLTDLLKENLKDQDSERQKFLFKLEMVFEEFQMLGDTHLEFYDGNCDECNKCHKGFSFVGNISKMYLDLIIESDQGKVNDIFECSNFINNSKHILKRGKKYLDDNPF